ncbi:MAG: sulfatase-like hydrolase/transferase [Bacteroidia bacterium]|nr:sulfatase-like hydrolase/transferase [Bacteroidia bacterium]
MKKILAPLLFLASPSVLFSQTKNAIENIIIITTDGFRWQEVFNGLDSSLTEMAEFNQGKKKELYAAYGATTREKRRKMLMPFLWSTVEKEGQIYGNRKFGNKVDNSNPYWFSYPGYSEIFCGFVDSTINSNEFPPNPNTNVLEFFNKQPALKNKVAAFGAWNAFDRIFNEKRSGFPIVCGMEPCGGSKPDSAQQKINELKKNTPTPFDESEHLDIFTQAAATDLLQKQKPRVLYISYGETDEWAHSGQYWDYLNSAHKVDKWIGDLWRYIQTVPQYKNKTALFITVDHGRGYKDKKQWTSHNNKISDSHEIWFAVIGPGIPAKGEVKKEMQVYQKQFAQTFAELLGLVFKCEHAVAAGLKATLVK